MDVTVSHSHKGKGVHKVTREVKGKPEEVSENVALMGASLSPELWTALRVEGLIPPGAPVPDPR